VSHGARATIGAAGFRRMVSKMSPKIFVAVEPAHACDPAGQRRDDPALRLFLIKFLAVVIRQGLVR
jgi:hypothetical protein